MASLNLANNNLEKIQQASVEGLSNLKVLILISNPLKELDDFASEMPLLKLVMTDEYKLCCLIMDKENTICTQDIVWPGSCGKLIENLVILCSSFCVSISVIILNFASMFVTFFLLRILTKENMRKRQKNVSKNYKYIVIFFNIADIQVGFHLVVITAASHIYGDSFAGSEYAWRESTLCHFISSIMVFSNVFSIFMSLYMAVSRFTATKYPFKAAESKSSKWIVFLLLKSTSMILLAFICYIFVEGHTTQPLSICVLLGNPSGSLITVITSIYISILQVLGTICLLPLYVGILVTLANSSPMSGNKTEDMKRKTQQKVTYQAVIIGITNIVSWIPSSLLYIVSLVSTSFPPQLLLVNLVFLIPINALINPLVFNFKYLKCRKCHSAR